MPLGATPPSKWVWLPGPTRIAERCKLRGVIVRLLNHHSAEELSVTVTDAIGTYILAAPIGMQIEARLQQGNHTEFARAAWDQLDTKNARAEYISEKEPVQKSAKASGACTAAEPPRVFVYHIPEHSELGSSTWAAMDFYDRKVATLVVGAHGTRCSHKLGDTTHFRFSYAMGPMCYLGASKPQDTIALETEKHVSALFSLPAHQFDLTIAEVEPSYSAATDMSANGFFHRLRLRTVHVDLFVDSAEERAVSFEFRPRPSITVSFHATATNLEHGRLGCNTKETTLQVNGKWHKEYMKPEAKWRLDAGASTTAIVSAEERLAGLAKTDDPTLKKTKQIKHCYYYVCKP